MLRATGGHRILTGVVCALARDLFRAAAARMRVKWDIHSYANCLGETRGIPLPVVLLARACYTADTNFRYAS